LFLAYGRLDPKVGEVVGEPISDVLTAPRFLPRHASLLKLGRIDYVVVDRRLSTDLPGVGFYVDRDSEPKAFEYERPLPRSAVTKFETVPGLKRIYDNGEIAIYDTGDLAGGYSPVPGGGQVGA
jgi:hypothetical protein